MSPRRDGVQIIVRENRYEHDTCPAGELSFWLLVRKVLYIYIYRYARIYNSTRFCLFSSRLLPSSPARSIQPWRLCACSANTCIYHYCTIAQFSRDYLIPAKLARTSARILFVSKDIATYLDACVQKFSDSIWRANYIFLLIYLRGVEANRSEFCWRKFLFAFIMSLFINIFARVDTLRKNSNKNYRASPVSIFIFLFILYCIQI